MSSSEVFVWGKIKMEKGQSRIDLNLNNDIFSKNQTCPLPLLAIQNSTSPAISVFAGYFQSTILIDNGSCYEWRKDKKNGIDSKKILIPHDICNVQHGTTHSIALGLGNLWGWGSSINGKLGQCSTKTKITRPIPISIGRTNLKCVSIGCGDDYSITVMENGTVFLLGKHPEMQVTKSKGISSVQKIRPLKISMPIQIHKVACGPKHTILLSCDRGQIFSWGCGQYGRLGHGDEIARPRPELILSLLGKYVMQIACGGAHTIIVTKQGNMLGFGWNVYGQVGNGRNDEKILSPTNCEEKLKDIADISCGFGHSAANTINGELYTWGSNKEGQLGHGHRQNLNRPTKVRAFDENAHRFVVSISCGYSHSLCVSSCEKDGKSNNIKQEQAKQVIFRFGTRVSLILRQRKASIELEDKSSIASPDLDSSLDSDYSDDSKEEHASQSQNKLEEEEYNQLLIERAQMTREDHISSEVMEKTRIELSKIKNELDFMKIEEMITKRVWDNMKIVSVMEDVIKKMLQDIERRKKLESEEKARREKKKRDIAVKELRKEQLLKVREQMKKEANRLSKARDLHKNSKEYPILPKVKMKYNHKGKENKQIIINRSKKNCDNFLKPMKPSREKNEKLIRRRNERLEKKKQLELKLREKLGLLAIEQKQKREKERKALLMDKKIEAERHEKQYHYLREKAQNELSVLYEDLDFQNDLVSAYHKKNKNKVKLFKSAETWARSLS